MDERSDGKQDEKFSPHTSRWYRQYLSTTKIFSHRTVYVNAAALTTSFIAVESGDGSGDSEEEADRDRVMEAVGAETDPE